MEGENWKPILRELGVNQDIEKIIEEKVKEPQPQKWYKTDFTEFVLKVITAFSILIPLLLFYFQYQTDNTKKRNEDLTQIYTDVAFDVETVLNSAPKTDKFTTANDNLLFRYPSKIALFKNEKLNTSFTDIIKDLKVYTEVKKIKNLHDTIYDNYSSLFRYFSILKKRDEVDKIEFYQKSDPEVLAIVLKCLPLLSQYQNLIQSHPHDYFQYLDTVYKSDSVINQTSKEIIKMLEKKTDMQNKLDFLKTYLTTGDKAPLKYIAMDEMQELNRLNGYLIKQDNAFRLIIDKKRKEFQNQVLQEIND
ncbi:MAG: hypothetical protein JST02_12430 [Bacteroidetes bacterium]|nr:hypothetical protein [Bacteroidota bacterium]